MDCRICNASVTGGLEFGPMPIANAFLDPEDVDEEAYYDLAVGVCQSCGMWQILEQPDRDAMFHDEYAYFSSTSEGMKRHFEDFAETVMTEELGEDPFVVEIGSNDGIMLRHFADAGIDHLGVEPARNVGQAAVEKGVDTIFEFFEEETADQILDKEREADAILAANVMCHVPYLHSVVEGIRRLLAPEGVFIFEDPYLGDILDKTSYDQIYDEHAFYFSLTALDHLMAEHDLEVVDVEPQDVHGGSMRYTVAHEGAREPTTAVKELRKQETERGIDEPGRLEEFASDVQRSRDELMDLLERLREEGQRVVGYGATSKSTTVTNYCGITPNHVEFISDTTPTKQGKVSPGAHIPIKPPEAFHEDYPDYALLFAWNHAKEIMAKEQEFVDQGGKWITYVPEVQVIG